MMKVKKSERPPSEGICYGCRHDGDVRFSTSGHCYGKGHLEPGKDWPGFICVCTCVPVVVK